MSQVVRRGVACLVVLAAVAGWGCDARKTGTAGAAVVSAKGKKVYDRPEFEALIVGKTKQEVIDLLGKPESTTGGTPDRWEYQKITRDPVNGKVDFISSVWFTDDVAGSVTFVS